MPQAESKSYFLYDLFMKVVFPDGELAVRSKAEIRRQLLMRLAIALSAAALAFIVAIPSIVSYLNNRALVADTLTRAQGAAAVVWDAKPVSQKVKPLAPLLERLDEIDAYGQDLPFGLGWMMYQGDTLYKPAVKVYLSQMQTGFVVPCKTKLEQKLKAATGDNYLKDRLALKTYLMMSDVEHLDVDWETGQLTLLWAEVLRPTADMPEYDLRKEISKHVR